MDNPDKTPFTSSSDKPASLIFGGTLCPSKPPRVMVTDNEGNQSPVVDIFQSDTLSSGSGHGSESIEHTVTTAQSSQSTKGHIFGKGPSLTTSPASLTHKSTVFGNKMATIDEEETVFSRRTKHVPEIKSSLFDVSEETESKYDFKSSWSSPPVTKPLRSSPVFSSLAKAAKGPTTSTLFGGQSSKIPSITFTPTPNIFGVSETSTFEEKSKKGGQILGQSGIAKRSGFPNIPKPSLVFGSKFEQKEPKPTHEGVFSGGAKESGSVRPGSVGEKRKALEDESYDIFDTPMEPLPTPLTSPQKESTMLIAVDIPQNFFDKSILENHFKKYGIVKKILLNKKSNQASIYFNTHKDAAEAKARGKKLHPRIPEMKLFFGAVPQSKKRLPEMHRKLHDINKYIKVEKRLPPPSLVLENYMEKPKPPTTAQKRPEIRSKAPSGNLGSIKDFAILAKSQARNNYDRYLILDARDKSLRAKQKKEVDVKKAHYLLASCPDMCPEKERYSRDIQYDVSTYEKTNDEIDHRLTVKKFSRSSADKDEPLPHELRPGPVLRMTMDFLISHIMNKGDDKGVQVDLWYNYLLNRTRALRNDIMQQHLLDSNAVYVLERCTRFHIHCSHYLCEEPSDYFDPKINSEHLTKSLQSLKELYHDMGEKGVHFGTESEFRAYEMLLCINDGNVIFKYLKFKDGVRNSPEVQFAVKVLQAIHTNNFVQFFRLVKKATYLQSCVMHRYFASVREKALKAIIKAYKSQHLPYKKLMALLGFWKERIFEAFINHFNLDIVEDSKVVLDKSKLASIADIRAPLMKSPDLILRKKKTSTGEIVNNGTLPEDVLYHYHPHDSFNSEGFLRKDALTASDQCYIADEGNEELQTNQSTKDDDDDEDTLSLQRQLYAKVEEMDRMRLTRRYFQTWKQFVELRTRRRRKLDQLARNLMLKHFVNVWRQKVAKTADANRKADMHRLSKYFLKWKTHTETSLERKDFVQRAKVVEERLITRKMFTRWRAKTTLKKSVRMAKTARKYLLARKYFSKWLIHHTRSLTARKKSEVFYTRMILKTYFNNWKSWNTLRMKKNKIDFELFPAIAIQHSSEEANKLLHSIKEPQCHLAVSQIAELDKEIRLKSRKHTSLQQLSGIVAWTPLPLLQRFQSNVNSSAPNFSGNVFASCFKVLLLIAPHTDNYLLQWVRTKFNILEDDDLSAPLEKQAQFTSPRNEVTYTVIIVEKEISEVSQEELCGASVALLVGNKENEEELQEIALSNPTITYITLTKCNEEDPYHPDFWRLSKLEIDHPSTSEQLFNIIFDLWKQRGSACFLRQSFCSTLADGFITENVLLPICHTVQQREFHEDLTICPSKVVELYNASVEHLSSCVNICQSLVRNWPPTERNLPGLVKPLNDDKLVSSAFEKALLPPFTLPTDTSWDAVERYLKDYITDVIPKGDWGANVFSEVNKIMVEMEKRRNLMYEECGVIPSSILYAIPWVDVLICCIFYKVRFFPDLTVAYRQEDIDSFQFESLVSAIRTQIPPLPLIALGSEGEAESTEKRKASSIDPTSQPKKRKTISSRLLQDLEEEKRKALELEEELKAYTLPEEDIKLLFLRYGEPLACCDPL